MKTHTPSAGVSVVLPALTSPFVFIRAAACVFSSRTLSLAHYWGFAGRLWGGSAPEEFHNVLALPNYRLLLNQFCERNQRLLISALGAPLQQAKVA